MTQSVSHDVPTISQINCECGGKQSQRRKPCNFRLITELEEICLAMESFTLAKVEVGEL